MSVLLRKHRLVYMPKFYLPWTDHLQVAVPRLGVNIIDFRAYQMSLTSTLPLGNFGQRNYPLPRLHCFTLKWTTQGEDVWEGPGF